MSTQNPSGTPSSSPSTPPSTSTPPPTDHLASPARKRTGTIGTGVAIAIAVVLLIVGIGGGYVLGASLNKSSSSSSVALTETGSSLLYPLFNSYWFPNYTAPGVTLSAASTGSGTGQSDAETGLVNIGASDAYLLNASATNLINVPVAISAQLVYYNLPAPLNAVHLNFNGTLLAMIYEGTITTWNNPLILAAQSPGVASEISAMSSQTIYVTKRSDSSGDTFLFTTLCSLSWKGFTYPVSTSGLSGLTGADVLEGDGNSGMVSTMHGQVGSIGYIGISYEGSAASNGLEYAALGDNATLANGAYATAAADYILPSAANISENANLALQYLNFKSYGLAISLILGGFGTTVYQTTDLGLGGTNPTSTYSTPYPDDNLEYTLIKTAPTGSIVTSAALTATVAFEKWAISYGNYNPSAGPSAPSAWITAVNFVPLTPEVVGYDMQVLAGVST
jgi:ABC-type phosphate transport system substrate-binding protein